MTKITASINVQLLNGPYTIRDGKLLQEFHWKFLRGYFYELKFFTWLVSQKMYPPLNERQLFQTFNSKCLNLKIRLTLQPVPTASSLWWRRSCRVSSRDRLCSRDVLATRVSPEVHRFCFCRPDETSPPSRRPKNIYLLKQRWFRIMIYNLTESVSIISKCCHLWNRLQTK